MSRKHKTGVTQLDISEKKMLQKKSFLNPEFKQNQCSSRWGRICRLRQAFAPNNHKNVKLIKAEKKLSIMSSLRRLEASALNHLTGVWICKIKHFFSFFNPKSLTVAVAAFLRVTHRAELPLHSAAVWLEPEKVLHENTFSFKSGWNQDQNHTLFFPRTHQKDLDVA